MLQSQKQGQSSGFARPDISGSSVATVEQFGHKFFPERLPWWDNGLDKKGPKNNHKGLWVEGSPSRVKAKLAILALDRDRIQSSHGLRSRVPKSLGHGDNVSKLCREGRLKEAVHLVEIMIQRNSQAPVNSYVSLLKECARSKALMEGKRVHALISESGLDSDVFLGNIIVDMYAKCGSVLDAHKVFNKMPVHNVFSWTAIISAYATHGHNREAINLFQQMQRIGIAPDKVAFIVVLKACTRSAALEQGKQLHCQIIRSGFDSDVVVGSVLVDMYAKCGSIEHALEVFNNMRERNVVSWNSIIAGCAQQGLGKEALALYAQMQQEDMQPNNVTYVALLKACASMAALEQGKLLHSDIIKSGIELDVVLGTAVVDMYAKCGSIKHALQVFNSVPERNVVTWNVMIAGYAQRGLFKEALAQYEDMKEENIEPNNVTYIVLLKACASIAEMEQGKRLHYHIIKSGLESDMCIGNTLIDMYSKCGSIEHALQVFNNMHERDVVSWTAMIAGYVQRGLVQEALALYEHMKEEHVHPNNVTYSVLLKACASISALEQGKQLHSQIIKSGFDSDVFVENTLVDMYAKCGSMEDAHQVFQNMRERDIVSWNAMIAGYVQQGFSNEALALYGRMEQEGLQPDRVTFALLLKACGSISALGQGKQLHLHMIRSGFDFDAIAACALIDMYAKCGCLEHAREVFNNMHDWDLVSWNVMVRGCAQQGLGKEALTLFEQMQREGMTPNEVTYLSVLSACSHSGLVEEGCCLFDFMCEAHGLMPTLDHYACMVDLLGRAGHLADAEDFINNMPIPPDVVVWMALLGAARNHGHVEIGRRAFGFIVRLEPINAAAYVLLSSIYAAAGRSDELAKVRKEMEALGMKRTFGCS